MRTIGYNMIVGKGEAKTLDRCLSQVQKLDLDEIVITLSHNDEDVKNVANKYTDKVYIYSDWMTEDEKKDFLPERSLRDFGGARNYCLSMSETDYVMWLDTDDLLTDNMIDGFKEAIGHIRKGDRFYYVVNYLVSFDPEDRPVEKVKRIFCFKRGAGITWLYRIHEGLNVKPGMNYAFFENIHIEHRPGNKGTNNRNLEILEEIYNSEKNDARTTFYYAKELYIKRDFEKAIPVLKEFLKNKDYGKEELAQACLMLANYYVYDMKGSIKKESYMIGETFAELGKSYCDKYAEFSVIIGDIRNFFGLKEEAVVNYKECFDKKLNARLSQDCRFYKFIPAEKLTRIYFGMGDPERALVYNAEAIKTGYAQENTYNNRKKIIKYIIDTEDERINKNKH